MGRDNKIDWDAIAPSALIRVAVLDTLSVIQRDDAIVSMDSYGYFDGEKCSVCFATSVLLQDVGFYGLLDLTEFNEVMGRYVSTTKIEAVQGRRVIACIMALDNFRLGYWREGLYMFYEDHPDGLGDLIDDVTLSLEHINPDWDLGQDKFLEHMKQAAEILEVNGF